MVNNYAGSSFVHVVTLIGPQKRDQ